MKMKRVMESLEEMTANETTKGKADLAADYCCEADEMGRRCLDEQDASLVKWDQRDYMLLNLHLPQNVKLFSDEVGQLMRVRADQ